MGQAEVRNRASLVSRVDAAILATTAATAAVRVCADGQTELASTLHARLDAHQRDANYRFEVVQQALRQMTETERRRDDLFTLRLKSVAAQASGALTDERLIRLRDTDAIERELRAFRGMRFLDRLKWLLFGADPRPAAAPKSKKHGGPIDLDALRALAAPRGMALTTVML